MARGVIIAGFHRSGTSMLAQLLHRAGLFVGWRLLPPSDSNADGHYEDREIVRLHERILASRGLDWQYCGGERIDVPESCRERMRFLARTREERFSLWGFKDPRSLLFLEEWTAAIAHPLAVGIYRRYDESVRSLFHRAVRRLGGGSEKKSPQEIPGLLSKRGGTATERCDAVREGMGSPYAMAEIPHYIASVKHLAEQEQETAEYRRLLGDLARKEKLEELCLHNDQISMSLALTESGLPLQYLHANENFPVHEIKPLRSLRERQVTVLHYHRELGSFGLIREEGVPEGSIREAVEKANRSIAAKEGGCRSYPDLLEAKRAAENGKGRLLPPEIETRVREMAARLPDGCRVILHGGSPKTGTTTLQFHLHSERDALRERGILYPSERIWTKVPKHQWIVATLLEERYEEFVELLSRSLSEGDQRTRAVLFSTEGIYNHWPDFSPAAKELLSLLGRSFNLEIWLWLRDPYSFALSYYRQNLKNPRIEGIRCYGRDLSFREMLKDPWFAKRLNYLSILLDMEKTFSKETMRIFAYEGGDIVRQAGELLGVEMSSRPSGNKNVSLGGATTEMLRIVNRHPVSWEEKQKLLCLLGEIDGILRPYRGEEEGEREARELLEPLLAPQMPHLRERYGLSWREVIGGG